VPGLLVFTISQFTVAQDQLFAGTWKVEVAKSKYQPGAVPKRQARFTYAFKRIDDRTWDIVIKVNGERRILVHNVVSDDGKTMRGVSTAVTNQGQVVSQDVIYQKQ